MYGAHNSQLGELFKAINLLVSSVLLLSLAIDEGSLPILDRSLRCFMGNHTPRVFVNVDGKLLGDHDDRIAQG